MKKRNKPNQNSAHQVQRTCDHTKATQQAIHRRKLKEKKGKNHIKHGGKPSAETPKEQLLSQQKQQQPIAKCL